MFFKNVSEFQCGVRTKSKVLTVYPGNCIRILEGDLISISDSFEEISYEEYLKFTQGKDDDKNETKVVTESKKEPVIEPVEIPIPASDAMPVNPTQTEQEKLEKQLEELKKAWQEASRPKRKETIQNEIKAVQEKLNKLKG